MSALLAKTWLKTHLLQMTVFPLDLKWTFIIAFPGRRVFDDLRELSAVINDVDDTIA